MANQNDIINALSGGGQASVPNTPPGMGTAPQGMGQGGDVENQINQFLISLPLPVKKAVVDALYKSQGSGQAGGQGMPMQGGQGIGMGQ